MSKNSEITETRNTASFAVKRAKRRHLRDTVSYIFEDNGAGGIRTPDDPEAILDFESSAFNRSATAPMVLLRSSIDHQILTCSAQNPVFGGFRDIASIATHASIRIDISIRVRLCDSGLGSPRSLLPHSPRYRLVLCQTRTKGHQGLLSWK
jgi:hypothetical protein